MHPPKNQRAVHSKTNFIRDIIMECVEEVFTEAVKAGTEQDVRGILGFPFDKYIVPLSIKVDNSGEESGTTIYSWKLAVPVDDPEVISNLTEDEETYEERLLETIAKRLRSEARPGSPYTSGFAEVIKRGRLNGEKTLILQVEMTVGWDE